MNEREGARYLGQVPKLEMAWIRGQPNWLAPLVYEAMEKAGWEPGMQEPDARISIDDPQWVSPLADYDRPTLLFMTNPMTDLGIDGSAYWNSSWPKRPPGARRHRDR